MSSPREEEDNAIFPMFLTPSVSTPAAAFFATKADILTLASICLSDNTAEPSFLTIVTLPNRSVTVTTISSPRGFPRASVPPRFRNESTEVLGAAPSVIVLSAKNSATALLPVSS